MSFGVGFGTAFGGDPPVTTESPASQVGDQEPVTFDFADDVDGPLPGEWQFYELTDDGVGGVTGAPEPNPDTYFRVQDGLGFWDYLRSPASGSPFVERGVAASPTGILEGRNAELAVAFVPPPTLLDGAADEFFLEVTAGLRTRDDGASFVGARASALWQAGVWVTPVAFEIVRASMTNPTVAAAYTFDYPNPLDPWCAGLLAEVRVELRGQTLKATLSGAQAALEIDDATLVDSAIPLVMVRVYNRIGLTFVGEPIVAGIQLRTLRDEERLGPAPCLEGHEQLKAPLIQTTIRMPIRDIQAQGLIKQAGPREFLVVQEFEVDEGGVKSRWPVGTKLFVPEPVQNQTLMAVVPDLASIRAAKVRA